MAEIADSGGGGHKKGGKRRAKKQSTRVDMTPMVDLAFLLLTFFVLTSTFSKPKSMELSLPAPPDDPKTQPPVKNGVTFLLTKEDKIFYYVGEFYQAGNPDGKEPTTLKETNFSSEGLHKLLAEQNKWAIDEIEGFAKKNKSGQMADTTFKRKAVDATADRRAITVLIKTDDQATYKNAIDMLDELKINNVGKRVLGVDMSAPEYALLQEKIR
jgi:biopolymer transport protein ExbD